MFSLRTIALKHVSSQHPIKCNTVAFDVISYILLLSLPVKGQVLPDEEMDHPTQVQLQNLKQPVRDVEIKNNSPVSWSCFPSGSRLSAFCFFTNPERRNCSGWGALQCNKGGLKLPLSTAGGTTLSSSYACRTWLCHSMLLRLTSDSFRSACSKKCCFNHVLLHLLLFVVTWVRTSPSRGLLPAVRPSPVFPFLLESALSLPLQSLPSRIRSRTRLASFLCWPAGAGGSLPSATIPTPAPAAVPTPGAVLPHSPIFPSASGCGTSWPFHSSHPATFYGIWKIADSIR